MIRKIVLGAAALAVFTTAVGVTVVAAAFALYALLADDLGPAGAAASVAGAAAALVILGAVILALKVQGPRSHRDAEPSLMDKLMSIARDRPVLAAGGALLAGLIALKNPRLAAGLASAFMAGKAAEKTDPRDRRRR